MSYKKEIGIGVAMAVFGIAYASLAIETLLKWGICKDIFYEADGYIAYCFGYVLNQTIGSFALVLFLLFLTLFFLKESIYRSWRKFALCFLPVYVLSVAAAPQYAGGGWISLGFDRETVSMLLSAFFFIISLILIAHKSYKLRGK